MVILIQSIQKIHILLIDRKIKNPCIRSNTLWMNGFGNDRDSLLYSPAKTYLCWRVCIFGTKYT